MPKVHILAGFLWLFHLVYILFTIEECLVHLAYHVYKIAIKQQNYIYNYIHMKQQRMVKPISFTH